MIRRWIVPILIALAIGALAFQVTLMATPGTLMALAMNRLTTLGPINHFAHTATPTPADREIVRTSPDLAYSPCPFDLSGGPLLINAVPVAAPYWALSIFDAQTNAVFVRNRFEAQDRPFRVAVIHGGQVAPPGYEPVRVDGARGIAVIRILVADPASFPAIDAARRASTCRIG